MKSDAPSELPPSLGSATRSKPLALANAHVATLVRSRTRRGRLAQTLRQSIDGFARLEDDAAAAIECPHDRVDARVDLTSQRAGAAFVRPDLPEIQKTGRQSGVDVGRCPAMAKGMGKGKRIGGTQAKGPRSDEKGVECQGARPAAVVGSLRRDVHNRPWAALETKREEALGGSPARGRLAKPLADGFQFDQPFGTASRRAGQDGVSPIPEREAPVHGLLESDVQTQRHHETAAFFYSGRLSVGTWKSEANTRVVFPPLVGVMVPDKARMARGSPCRLWSTYTSLADQS